MRLARPRLSLAPRHRSILAVAGGVVVGGGLLAAATVALSAPMRAPTGTPVAVATAAPEATTEPVPTMEPLAIEAAPPSSFAGIAEPPPEPPRRTAPIAYSVEEGDVLWQIAERFSLRSETLVWANDLVNADLLQIGQKLLIPPVDGVFYTVQPDDRLADVATRYGVDVTSVTTANNVVAASLTAGEDIFLPGARPIRRSTAVVEAPLADPEQYAAALPPIPLPDDVNELRAAGWLRTSAPTSLFRAAEPNARALQDVPPGARLERLEGFSFGRIEVRDPGDGRTRQAMTGWVNAIDLDVGVAPRASELPLAYPMDTAMDIAHVFAPYRTQLDGAPYAEANCGPVAVGMALDAFGTSVSSAQLRREVQAAQGMYGNHIGSLITALARVVESHGLRAHGLHNASGGIDRWTEDDVAQQIALGRPVIVQVRYRSLPGRSGAYYFGDHYILVTGVVPGGFLYNDPINHDGIGWDRFIPAGRLATAMDASDRRYAFSAFSVSR